MRFGPVALSEAEGAILAHSVALPGGRRLRKGAVLDPAACRALAAAGLGMVTVARLDPEDVTEDDAAARLAAALVPDPEAAGLRVAPAATGRANIFATGPGILRVDAEAIDAANAVDPAITVATLPRWHRVHDGVMVATVKIIAYGVAGDRLDTACEAAQGALSRRAAMLTRVDFIETRIDGVDLSDKGRRATEDRLTRLGATLGTATTVPHDTAALAASLRAATGEAVLILTASATSDARDVAPEAVREAGGTVLHFGMPVDPGNLLFVGHLPDGKPVIGLPGCARAPALNGADWVLERVLCGVPVGPAEITRMGVGGLLKEVPQRGRPRDPGAMT